jgi:toxin ParE1/3/4
MRRIIWTDEAVGNLEAIVAYISAFNPAAARRLAHK